MKRIKKVLVILNPGASPREPILGQLNEVFTKYHIKWEIRVTKSLHEAIKITQKAIKQKPDAIPDAVVVYGGDGSVLAVASVLYLTDIPLVIIPGGTANVLAKELGVSVDNMTALAVFGRKPILKQVDAIMCDDKVPFFLRIEVGVLAKMVTNAPKSHKQKWGLLAYPAVAIRQFFKSHLHTYQLELDGKQRVIHGVSLMIANSGNVGLPGLSIQPTIDCDDGILDVLVLKSKRVRSLFAVASSVLLGTTKPLSLKHWKVKKVTITLNQSQQIIRDDVPLKVRQLTASVTNQKLKVLV